ncbi:MAG: right-handed parallel beta-helix repeat-containing protein [Pirellulales bacterium]|nr:right-handed parallel beta-helix repeat-containing protein [Pirellulales bacterium]
MHSISEWGILEKRGGGVWIASAEAQGMNLNGCWFLSTSFSAILFWTLALSMALSADRVPVRAAEWHVSVGGSENGKGTREVPFRTIQRAAKEAEPGDIVTVHEGVYRERISPPRGGESDKKRIVYQAAEGEQVEIKGSEVVRGWEKCENDTWKVTLPHSFFGEFNPYRDLIRGDWFAPRGREHHTGAVYFEGAWMQESAGLEEVLGPTEKDPRWFAKCDEASTTIWAQFPGGDPNAHEVEIHVRQTVFYPSKPGVNYITLRGFTLRHAATPWAPPTAEQIGLVGTHWSKGWIIENNVVSDSTCSGISLGKYGDRWDNTSADTAEGYVKTIERALANGWNRETIGHHIVRNNTISDCGQAGIVGSLGAAFSEVSGNHIHQIHMNRLFSGAEMAGIKFHGAIDVLIRNNRIHRTCRGIWLDWMAQGTRVSGNLLYDNGAEDLFCEVDHGPFVVDNNLFLSKVALLDVSEGGAYLHNWFAGKIISCPDLGRLTPYHLPHSTKLAGLRNVEGGDNRFYNNIFVGEGLFENPIAQPEPVMDDSNRVDGFGLWVYNKRKAPLQTGGNLYFGGAYPYRAEADAVRERVVPRVEAREEGGRVSLSLNIGPGLRKPKTVLVTTSLLGQANVPQLPFENADGSPLHISTDCFGKARSQEHPTVGPIESLEAGVPQIFSWGSGG